MAPNICRGCIKPLIYANNVKNIFTDNFEINESGKSMQISAGLERMIGQKVSKSNDLPDCICENCLKKLAVCLNFQTQLLNSLNLLLNSPLNADLMASDKVSKDFSPDDLETPAERTCSSDSAVEDQIKVDDSCSDQETSDDEGRLMRSMREEQDNNNSDTPDKLTVDIHSYSPQDMVKSIDNDIESDIDVCSGEDDEILELDVNSTKDETIDLDNSSESDIDVCDYEPSGKRMKNFSSLSVPIQF